MTAQYPHLHDSVRIHAGESIEARIRHIRSERWITYPRAETALLQLEDLLTFPKRTRMPNMLHTDDPNPHVHVVVRAISEEGKRLHIRKATLHNWRTAYAHLLRRQTIAAKATRRWTPPKQRASAGFRGMHRPVNGPPAVTW
jgi:site-specific recombinase XerC